VVVKRHLTILPFSIQCPPVGFLAGFFAGEPLDLERLHQWSYEKRQFASPKLTAAGLGAGSAVPTDGLPTPWVVEVQRSAPGLQGVRSLP
jgi:hypothetical protein